MYITRERVSFVKDIAKLAYENMLNISNGNEILEIKYKSSILDVLGVSSVSDAKFSEENIVELMMKKIFR